MNAEERDRLAEEWLMARHHRDWYIGEGTEAEWREAYAAIDADAPLSDNPGGET